jgi:hypothetical protein
MRYVCSSQRRLLRVVAVLFSVLSGPGVTQAQMASATLSGTVYDVSGAVVPSATVVLKNEATGASRAGVSNGSGYFSFPAILPGSYTVTVTSSGFKAWVQRNINISEAESRNMPNIQLQVGMTTETVTVETGVEAIAPVNTGASATTLNENMVANIAIQGRDAAELIKLMPGMAMSTGLAQNQWNSLTTQSNSGPVGQFSASGTQPNGGMQLTVDGGLLVDTGNMGTQTANINQDQTAEVTIRNSAFDAEYSRGPVTVEATGKSGAQLFHGGAYLYARGGTFNSNDSYFNAKKIAKPNDHYWYPGFDLGGPVIIPGTRFNRNRDKLFFYSGYEYMVQHPAGALHQLFVPTADMLKGNFSPAVIQGLNIGGYGPIGTVPCATSNSGQWWFNNYCSSAEGQTIQNGQIPASLLDSNALALAKLFPTPNIDPTQNGGNNFQFIDNPPVNRWEFKIRADYNITQKTHAYFSFNRQNETDFNNFGVWWWPSDTLPYPAQMHANQISNLWSASVFHMFTPALTNEVTFNYTSFINPIRASNIKAVSPGAVGYNVKNPFSPNITAMVPNLLSWGCQGFSNGGCFPGFWAPAYSSGFANGAFGALKRVPSVSDNVAWVKGTHTLKFGFFWAHGGNQQTEGAWAGAANAFPQGRFEFDQWAARTTGNPLADFVMGHAVNFAQTSADPVHTLWYNELAFYAQDSWKATRRLTLNFGVRFDHEGQWYESGKTLGMVVWDPSTCPASTAPGPGCSGDNLPGFTWHARNSSVPISGFPSRPVLADPRVGVAFDIFGNGRTVLRGGYGIYRYQLAYNDVAGSLDPPLGIQVFQTNCNLVSLAQIGTDQSCMPKTANGALPSADNGLGESALKKGDDRTPMVQNWTFLIDQRAPWHSLFEIGYVGSHTSDMLIAATLSNINQVPFGALFKPDPVTGKTYFCQGTPGGNCVAGGPNSAIVDFRPYNYGNLGVSTHGSFSNYNALQAMWQKQRGSSTFMVNYTFSKVLGIRDGQTNNGAGNGNVVDVFNIDNNYGVLAYDHTHIFNTAYIIGLPSLKRANPLVRGVVNGWQLSGILQLQSGAPIQPNTGGKLNVTFPGGVSNQSVLGTDADTLVPALTCDPRKGLGSGQYFNPNCFAMPTPHSGQNGSVIWPYIKGPKYFNTDLSLYKTFNIGERQHLQFRVQAFNFLNHAVPTLQYGSVVNLNFDTAGKNTNICDPVQNPASASNGCTDGRAHFKTGRRVMEFAIKYNF